MREAAHVALWVALMVAGTAQAATGADPAATPEDSTTNAATATDPTFGEPPRERLTDLLFSDDIDRIDFQATSFEAGTTMINATSDTILDIGLPILGDPGIVAARGVEVIEALDGSKIRGLYATLEKDKQTIFVRNATDAKALGEVVGTTISIIYSHYRSGQISYRDKAANLFGKVRMDPDDTLSMVERYLDTVQFVEKLSPGEQAKYLN